MMPLRFLVVDGNAPWVGSLFDAMPPEIGVDKLRVYSAAHFVREKIGPLAEAYRWRTTGRRTREQTVLVPGWTRAYGASAAIVQSCVRSAMQSSDDAFAIVFT